VTAQGKRILIWITSVVLAAGLITGGILWGISQIPPISNQLPPNQAPMIVIIGSPGNNTSWPADAFIPVRVSLQSETPIEQLELWVDGNLHQTVTPEPTSYPEMAQTLSWLPVETGRHRLYVYAQDEEGLRSISNIVTITAIEPAGFAVVESGVSPVENPAQHDILPPGTSNQPQPSSPPPPESAPLAISFQPPSGFSLWLADYLASDATLPDPPELSYSLDGCTVNLLIKDKSDSELGYFVYRSSPGSSAFERIDILGKIDQGGTIQFSDPDQKGPLDYYVAAFNQAGESPSNPIQAKFSDPNCLADTLHRTNPESIDYSFPPSVNLAYVYYAYNSGAYSRFPAEPGTFLNPTNHKLNLDLFVDSVVSWAPYPVSTVDLVLWGWEGGSLVNLGAWHVQVDRSDLTICNLGTGCTGDVASNFKSTYGTIASNAEDQLHEFYWTTTARGTTDILWQISTQPFQAGFQPHPAGLVAAGCQPGSGNGSFLVDFADLNAYLPGPAGCGSSDPTWYITPYLSIENLFSQSESMTYYARFTPMTGNQPAGDPSNTVLIHYGPGEDVIEAVIEEHLPPIYQIEIVDFQPIKLPDMTYWGCVSIISLDYDKIYDSFYKRLSPVFTDSKIKELATDLYNELKAVQDNNMIVCPTAYQGGDDDSSILSEWGSSLMEGLNAFWETIQSAVEGIKNTAVNLAAEAINTLGIDCEATCKANLKFGIETGLTYFTGVPPTLPDFDKLVDEGINYAIQMAAAEAGIPCTEECQDALRNGLKEVADLVKQTSSQPACVDADWAHLLGKNAFCFPEGVVTEPVPEGLRENAGVAVRITRPVSTAGIPTPDYSYFDMPAFVLRVRVFETNPGAAGRTYTYDYYYKVPSWVEEFLGSEQNEVIQSDHTSYNSQNYKYFTISATPVDVGGQVFLPHSIPIPPLTPGEEFTIPMSLGQDIYYFDEHIVALDEALKARGLATEDVTNEAGLVGVGGWDDWDCLYNGGTIKVRAELYCLSVPTGLSGTTGPTEDSYLVPCGAEAEPFIFQITSPLCQP
jgi:hypothetical protein